MNENKAEDRSIPGLAPDVKFGGRYLLVRRLGAGGMGEVWLAREEVLDREVALKILRPEDDSGDGKAARDVKRFHREASVLAACEHPSILPVFQSGEDAATGLLFYATIPLMLSGDDVRRLCVEVFQCPYPKDLRRWDEAPRALSLADLVQGGKTLDERAVARIGRAIVSAVAYAHSLPEPVFHRDIKPSNILFTKDGAAILSDFGIAKRKHAPGVVSPTLSTTSSERRRIFIGTYAYAAPEQMNGDGSTPAVDYYSIAAVLYEALTGQRPRSLSKPSEFDPKHISGIWDTLLPAMLASDPGRRLTDPKVIDDTLSKVETGRCRRMVKRANNAIALMYAVLGIAIAAAVAWLTITHPKSQIPQESHQTTRLSDHQTTRPPDPHTTQPPDHSTTGPPDRQTNEPTADDRVRALVVADKATSFGRHLPDAVKARAAGLVRTVELPGGLPLSFVWCRNDELPARDIYDYRNYDDSKDIPNIEIHNVVLSTNFCWMAQTEVTQAQWFAVMGGAAADNGDGDIPVLCTYFEAERFVERLNELGVVSNGIFAIPTESQWEHAARGISLKYFNDKKPEDLGWFAETSEGRLHPVAQKRKAGYGIYDAHGNASEWCRDGFAPQGEGPLVEPFVAPKSPNDKRVVRGGSFDETVESHLAEFRKGFYPSEVAGFRIALFDR